MKASVTRPRFSSEPCEHGSHPDDYCQACWDKESYMLAAASDRKALASAQTDIAMVAFRWSGVVVAVVVFLIVVCR